MIAGRNAKKGAVETEDVEKNYDPQKIENRAKGIDWINRITVGMLVGE